jgi:hypothetical protein
VQDLWKARGASFFVQDLWKARGASFFVQEWKEGGVGVWLVRVCERNGCEVRVWLVRGMGHRWGWGL